MRRGLIGDDVRFWPARPGAFHQLRQDLGGIAQQPDRNRFFRRGRFADQRQRLIQRGGFVIYIAGTQAEIDARLLTLNRQHTGPGQNARQRLRAAHAAQPGGEDPASAEVVVVVLTSRFHEGFVGALHDALRADIDPGTGGHLAVHHQTRFIQLMEVIPGRPVRHQIGVCQQHAGCIRVGAEDADRLAALDQQGFIRLQCPQ